MFGMIHKFSILLISLSYALGVSNGQCHVDTTVIADGLDVPWDLEWLDSRHLIFTEISGGIYSIDVFSKEKKELYRFENVAREAQAGLMGITIGPMINGTKFIYVVYAFYDEDNSLKTRVSRLLYKNEKNGLYNEKILLEFPCASTNLGGRILYNQGYLYITVGDMDRGMIAQDLTKLNGKVLRINVDGSIPAENPFPNSPIWTYGHRNPQGITMSPNGIYISEHGTYIDDEINLLEKGKNYGWPITSGFDEDDTLYQQPEYVWSPSIAPSGIISCHGCLHGDHLLVASLKEKRLYAFNFDPLGNLRTVQQHSLVENWVGRIRDVIQGVEPFEVYICTSNSDIYSEYGKRNDRIIKLKFSQCPE